MRAFLFFLSFCAFSLPARAAELTASIVPKSDFAIRGLKLLSDPVAVERMDDGRVQATVELAWSKKDWLLSSPDGVKIQTSEARKGSEEITQTFKALVPLTQKKTSFTLIAISPLGETERQTLELTDLSGLTENIPAGKAATGDLAPITKRWTITPSVGLAYLYFTQTSKADFSELAFSAALQADFTIWKFLGVGARVWLAAPALSSSVFGINAMLLSSDAWFGSKLPFIPQPWELEASLGFSHRTSYVTAAAFGYSDLFGPRVEIGGGRQFTKVGGVLHASFFWIPLTDGNQSFSYLNRELGLRASWKQVLTRRIALAFTLEYNRLAFRDTDTQLVDNVTTFNAGILF
ncbi:MAG: hypothetical protein ACXWP5_03545 [Bdellovibrionota bacterium]